MSLDIVIADDHQIFLQGLAGLIQATEELELIGALQCGAEALGLILERQPEIAVCDVSMEPFGAEEITRRIAQSDCATQVIALTVHDEPVVIRRVLDAGVVGYVLKISAFDDLRTAIATVHSGKRFISPVAAGILLDHDTVHLSHRERQVLASFAEGLAYKQIAANLGISIKTIETYRSRLMKKIAAKTTADLIRYAVENDIQG